MTSIDIAGCYRITDAGTRVFQHFLNLGSANLWYCNEITDETMRTLSQLTKLKFLNVMKFTNDSEREALINQMVMTIIYWVNFNALNERNDVSDAVLMHQGVYQIMNLIAPYLAESRQDFFRECAELYQEVVARSQDQ